MPGVKEKYPRENDTPLPRLADIGQLLLRCLNSGIHALACPQGSRAGCGVCRQSIGQPLLRCLNSGIHAVAMD